MTLQSTETFDANCVGRITSREQLATVHENLDSKTYVNLCRELGIDDTTRLDTSADGIRGVFLNRAVQAGSTILQIPLNKCIRDDVAPASHSTDGIEFDTSESYCGWATRLAAAYLDKQISDEKDSLSDLWFSSYRIRSCCARRYLPIGHQIS
jgi:hypothetical protein